MASSEGLASSEGSVSSEGSAEAAAPVSPMAAALATEKQALRETGGIVDGSVAVGVAPSTPRSPADVRPERLRAADPDAYPMPTGREEEWRFTPLDRVRVLLDGADSPAQLQLSSDLPNGVELTQAAAGELDVPLPVDRLAALAISRAGTVTVLRVPKGLELDEPAVLRLSGTGGEDVVWGHLVLDIGEQASAVIVLEHTGSARYAAMVSVLVADAASLELVSVQDWDGDAVHGAPRRDPARSRRTAAVDPGHARRRPRTHQRDRRVHRPRRRCRAARRLVRGRPPAPGAPAARRPRAAALPQPRHLQVGVAGRLGAHGVDR